MKMIDGKPVYSNLEIIFSLACMTFAATVFYFATFGKEKEIKADEAAFKLCKSQLELIAHPAWATVPRVDGRFDGPTYYFSWPGSLVFGGRSAAASCFVDRATLEIKSLTVNGKERIWHRPESP